MSNRLLALFILVVVFGGIFGAYWYFFVANVGSIALSTGSLTGVTVDITTPFKYTSSTNCDANCTITGVPPVDITLTAKKDGFDATTETFSLSRGEKKTLSVTLHKTVSLKDETVPTADKIVLLKLKKSIEEDVLSGSISPLGIYQSIAYAYTLAPSFSLFSYDENGDKKVIVELPTSISKVSWNEYDGILLLSGSDGKNGILSISTGVYTPLEALENPRYVKQGPRENLLTIVAADGAYLLDMSTGKISKDGIFDDYIIIKPGKILGLLRATSSEKMSLLNLPNDGKAKIILQDIATHDRKVVYSSDEAISGLIMNNGKIYALSSDGQGRELTNLEF